MVKSQTVALKKQQIRHWLGQARQDTLALFGGLDCETFCRQAHPDFSPAGWHLGHIAYIESYWILRQCAGLPPIQPEYDRLFVADSLPKAARINLPPFEHVCDYLNRIRDRVSTYLESAPLEQQERLWRWLIQHESQHSETIAIVLQLQRLARNQSPPPSHLSPVPTSTPYSLYPTPHTPYEMICIPAGYFEQGNESIEALDNERLPHQTYLADYWLDRYPITCGQFQNFIDAGGYAQKRWWSEAGWHWLTESSALDSDSLPYQISRPLYWNAWRVDENFPVCGVSWYEADAYARFVGKRLPTEAEWEKAASWNSSTQKRQTYPWGEDYPSEQIYCNHNHHTGMTTPVDRYPQGKSPYGCYDMLGNVWEWTASTFQPYAGFTSFPYAGYSSAYFDRQHFVLRGGSWATRPWALRASFRNWYHPHVRQIMAGFRCAYSD